MKINIFITFDVGLMRSASLIRNPFLIALAAASLKGCVIYYPAGQMEADTAFQNIATVPTCTAIAECDAKWNAARAWVKDRIGRPLIDNRADYMETEPPFPGSRSLAARIKKIQMEDGTYKIIATVWCSSPLQCDPLEVHSIANFNHDVNNAWPPK